MYIKHISATSIEKPNHVMVKSKALSKMAQRAAVSAAKHNDLRDPRWNEKSNV